jgi:hypothetical protein
VARYGKFKKMEHSTFDGETITIKSLPMSPSIPLLKKICQWVQLNIDARERQGMMGCKEVL